MTRVIELAKECLVYCELVGDMPEYCFSEKQLESFYQAAHREGQEAMRERCDDATKRIEELEAELERERIRLAACGVIALSNTEESAIESRKMHDDYWSAFAGDIAGAVDRDMKYRKRVEELEAMMSDFVKKEADHNRVRKEFQKKIHELEARLTAYENQKPEAWYVEGRRPCCLTNDPDTPYDYDAVPLYTNKIGEQK